MFKEGDKVRYLVKPGNRHYDGVIVNEPDTRDCWINDEGPTLAFRGENNVFAWLDVAERHLTRI